MDANGAPICTAVAQLPGIYQLSEFEFESWRMQRPPKAAWHTPGKSECDLACRLCNAPADLDGVGGDNCCSVSTTGIFPFVNVSASDASNAWRPSYISSTGVSFNNFPLVSDTNGNDLWTNVWTGASQISSGGSLSI